MKKFLTLVVYVFSIFFLPLAPLSAQASSCSNLVLRFVNFGLLMRQAQVAAESGEVSVPYWIENSLPEGARFIAQPLPGHAHGRAHKELGPHFVGIEIEIVVDGTKMTTVVGLSPEALADNITRFKEGKARLLTAEGSRVNVLFNHGGGTRQAGWQNAANFAKAAVSRAFATVSFDWLRHGRNKIDQLPRKPIFYTHVNLAIIEKLFPKESPIVVGGHSMGGHLARLMMDYYPKDVLAKEFPDLPLEGVFMLSPPGDPTHGGNLYEKVISRDKNNSPELTDALLEADNINLHAIEVMTDQYFLMNAEERLQAQENLPGFFAMGLFDFICWTHCEQGHITDVMNRPSVTSMLVSRYVDYHGKQIPAGHIIPEGYHPNPPSKEGVGATKPWVFAKLMEWVERVILGKKDFDIYGAEAADLSVAKSVSTAERVKAGEKLEAVEADNAAKMFRTQYQGILELFAKNMLFREFLKNFQFKGKQPVDSSKLSKLNTFIEGLDAFLEVGKKYEKRVGSSRVSNPNARVPLESSVDDWARFFNWMKKSPDERAKMVDTQEAQDIARIATEWSGRSEKSGEFFAVQLMAMSSTESGALTAQLQQELPPLPFHVDDLWADFKNADLAAILTGVEFKKNNIMSLRDLDMNVMVKARPEIASLQNENIKLLKKSDELREQRRLRLRDLAVVYSQKTQTQRIFLQKSNEHISKEGLEIRALLDSTPAIKADDASTFEEAQARYQYFLDLGWKRLAFDSMAGPDIRTLFSELDSKTNEVEQRRKAALAAKELDGPEAAKKQKTATEALARNENNFLVSFNKQIKIFAEELEKLRTAMDGDPKPSDHGLATLVAAQDNVRAKKAETQKANDAFYAFRKEFISENHQHWSQNSRPEYPEQYYKNIERYESAQQEYQKAKRDLAETQKKLSVEGHLGVYYKFLYDCIDSLDQRLSEIGGHDEKSHHQSLAALEHEMQVVQNRIEDINEELINTYASDYYTVRIFNGFDILNDPHHEPTPEELHKIIQAWNNVWRDSMGGQVDDSEAFDLKPR